MIVVVGQHPTAGNSLDGMVQRIASVDALLGDEERVYVQPRLEPFRFPAFNLTRVGPTVRVGEPNLFDRSHVSQLVALAREARAVIVHSVHWAQHVLPLYHLGHVITDMHGVVPEEQRMLGDLCAAERLERVERFVLAHSKAALVVSNAMAAHFRLKHRATKARLITLPVLSTVPLPTLTAKPGPPSVRLLYAGGTHVWQNVGPMLATLSRTPQSFEMDLLTPDVEVARRLVAEHRLEGRVQVRAVPPSHMPAAYARAHFGFVLRDDHVVNRAACPTKLQEYLAHGVMPVVKSEHMGDFVELGYRFVRVEDFEAGRLPGATAWAAAVAHNRGVFAALLARTDEGRAAVRALVGELPATCDAPPNAEDESLLWADGLLQRLEETRMALAPFPTELLLRLTRRLRLLHRHSKAT